MNRIQGGALALPLLLLSAAPALADAPMSGAQHYRADGHAPAGVMDDHVHKAGDVMLGLMWMREETGGANRTGTTDLTDAQIVTAGYAARVGKMTMDMAMLHLMWAPSDRVTLMVVPSWMRMEMTMLGIAPPAPGGGAHAGHGGHALAVGERHAHAVSGIGDTRVGALLALSRAPALSVHAGLSLSLPTGSVDRRNDDGTFVHYGMQPGSGTIDLIPSFTLRGDARGFSWGAQASYVFRAEEANASGFRFGDRFGATAWVAVPAGERLSLSGRLLYSEEGAVKGHYNGAHHHDAPPDRQANYGGRRLEAALGANLVIADGYRLGAEATLPLHQHLNGIQQPKRFGVALNASKAF